MKRRWWVPEVVQTSDMDCGPAALTALLAGFNLPVHYGRLREACQTDVDGTSIDTLEEVACRIGLDAQQVVIPVEHVFLPEAGTLPGLVVITLPNGTAHFVVMWSTLGPFVQVMDPGRGRYFERIPAARRDLYLHTMTVQAEDWAEWARSDDNLRGLRARLRGIGASPAEADALCAEACAGAGWFPMAALDAATRLVAQLAEAGGLDKGLGPRLLRDWLSQTLDGGPGFFDLIGPSAWTVRVNKEDPSQLDVTGAVVLQVRGLQPGATGLLTEGLSEDLRRALTTEEDRPGRDLWRMATADAALHPGWLAAAAGLAAAAVMVEALLLRGLLEAGRLIVPVEQRALALGGLLLFGAGLLAVELGLTLATNRAGRHLELRYRAAFLRKIPRLPDRYFQSRLVSDKAERGHTVAVLRTMGGLATAALRAGFGLLFTFFGVAALAPHLAPLAFLAVGASVGLPLLVQPALAAQDLRWRQHAGALVRLYLDALRGLVAIRTHGAERTLLREHEGLLREWMEAGLGLLRLSALAGAAQAALGLALTVALLIGAVQGSAEAPLSLLLAWWAVQLPSHGAGLAAAIQRYPMVRSVVLRLMEPLHSPEEPEPDVALDPLPGPVAISFAGVSVKAGGHSLLDGLDLEIGAGEHIAVVGPSGAGKSSLVGLLLGWHAVSEGRLCVNGEPLDAARLGRLRRHTAWVDPDVALWNAGLVDNLRYGGGELGRLGMVLEEADLRSLLEELPEGLATPLGEGGGLISGGQGQRARFGRALLRADVRLVILDEPFRGLDRDQRRVLLARARAHWKGATLLCITHDVADTALFERVVVVEGGRVVEEGPPAALGAVPEGRYAALCAAEDAVRRGLWSGPGWRRWRVGEGQLREGEPG
jgi:ATP-binding cassette subfamily B protein